MFHDGHLPGAILLADIDRDSISVALFHHHLLRVLVAVDEHPLEMKVQRQIDGSKSVLSDSKCEDKFLSWGNLLGVDFSLDGASDRVISPFTTSH